jgi:hypothetical protein
MSSNFQEKVLAGLNRLDANDQLLHSHSQSMAKIEDQVGQIANTLNMREARKRPSQLMVNPKGHYMVDGSTSHLEQVQAITTLRSGKMVNNHVEERNDEQHEAPHNLHREKGK